MLTSEWVDIEVGDIVVDVWMERRGTLYILMNKHELDTHEFAPKSVGVRNKNVTICYRQSSTSR